MSQVNKLDIALANHLTYNFYPALPDGYIAPAKEAIQFVMDGEGGVQITLPADLNPVPTTAVYDTDGTWRISAEDLFEVLRLDGHKFAGLFDWSEISA